MFCIHCGEWIHDCLCVEWCYKHDCLDVHPGCKECAVERREEIERKAILNSFSDPWHVRIIKFLTGG